MEEFHVVLDIFIICQNLQDAHFKTKFLGHHLKWSGGRRRNDDNEDSRSRINALKDKISREDPLVPIGSKLFPIFFFPVDPK